MIGRLDRRFSKVRFRPIADIAERRPCLVGVRVQRALFPASQTLASLELLSRFHALQMKSVLVRQPTNSFEPGQSLVDVADMAGQIVIQLSGL